MNARELELVARAREQLGKGRVGVTHDDEDRPTLDERERALADAWYLLGEALIPPGEDPLPPGWNSPAAASGEELHQVLLDVTRLVAEFESPEGFIEWTIPVPGPCEECGGTGKVRELRCPDGGKCYHDCASGGPRTETLIVGGQESQPGTCWRVHNASPLSSYGQSFWPKDAAPTLVEDAAPCPKCGGTGDQWEFEHLKGAEFAVRARYRVGGVGPGSGGMRVFTKQAPDG